MSDPETPKHNNKEEEKPISPIKSMQEDTV